MAAGSVSIWIVVGNLAEVRMFRCGLMAMIVFWVGLGIAVSFNISDRIQVSNMERAHANCSAGGAMQSFRSHPSAMILNKIKQADNQGRKEILKKLILERFNFWNSELKNHGPNTKDVAQYFRGESYFARGMYAEAQKDILTFPRLAPEIIVYFKARVCVAHGQYKQALALLLPHPQELRAYCHLMLNQHELAIKECNRMIKYNLEDKEEAYFIRAQAQQGLGENEKAIADYSRALYHAADLDLSFTAYLASNEPNLIAERRLLHNAEVYQCRAICYSYLDKFNDAKADWKKAVEYGYYPELNSVLDCSGSY